MSRRRRRRRSSDFSNDDLRRASIAGWVLLGLTFGLIGALYYAWVVSPVVYTDASPARFSDPYKREYLLLVSQSFALTGDWERAEQRLSALDEPDLSQTVALLLDDVIREQQPAPLIRSVAMTAQQLGVESAAVSRFGSASESTRTPTPTATAVSIPTTPTTTPTPQPTQQPTVMPTATIPATETAVPNFRLLDQQRICTDADAPRIEVVTLDAFLNPQPGVEVVALWQGGSDRFFTGFKPELGPAVGDFSMQPEVSYSIVLAEGSQEVSGLRIEPCDDGFAGGWLLTFQNLRFGATPTPEENN